MAARGRGGGRRHLDDLEQGPHTLPVIGSCPNQPVRLCIATSSRRNSSAAASPRALSCDFMPLKRRRASNRFEKASGLRSPPVDDPHAFQRDMEAFRCFLHLRRSPSQNRHAQPQRVGIAAPPAGRAAPCLRKHNPFRMPL